MKSRLESKKQAIELRKSGLTYLEIGKKLHISKGLLSNWFKKIPFSEKEVLVIKKHSQEVQDRGRLRASITNKYKRMEREKTAIEKAEKKFKKVKNESLFIAAMMLYAGEGDRSLINPRVRMANTDERILRIFIAFLLKYCDKSMQNIRFWLLSYPDLDKNICEKWWIHQLKLTPENMHKTQVIQGKHKTKRLRYGVGNVILTDKALKIMILTWIDLMCLELS